MKIILFGLLLILAFFNGKITTDPRVDWDYYDCTIRNNTNDTVWMAMRISTDSTAVLEEAFLLPVYSFEYEYNHFKERYWKNVSFLGRHMGRFCTVRTSAQGENLFSEDDINNSPEGPYSQKVTYLTDKGDSYFAFVLPPDSCKSVSYRMYSLDRDLQDDMVWTFYTLPFRKVVENSRAQIIQGDMLAHAATLKYSDLKNDIVYTDTVRVNVGKHLDIHDEIHMDFYGDTILLYNRTLTIPTNNIKPLHGIEAIKYDLAKYAAAIGTILVFQ